MRSVDLGSLFADERCRHEPHMPRERTLRLRRLEWFLESVPEPLLVIDAEGRIALSNAHSAELFGYPPGALVGLPVEALVPARLRERHLRDRLAFEGSPRDRPMGGSLNIVACRRDGSEFRADIELRPRNVEGERVVIAVVRETSLRRTQTELHSRDLERLARLSRLTAEDVIELLGIILASANSGLDEIAMDAPHRHHLEEIRNAATVAGDLAQQLLGTVEETDPGSEGGARGGG